MASLRGSTALHFLDRYAGIPALALCGLFRSKGTLPAALNSLGLLKTVAIGDTVLLSAIISDLREAFPRASILFFCGESNFEVARMIPRLDRVIQAPASNPFAAVQAIRSANLDILFDFGHWPRWDAFLTAISRARFTVGFDTPGQHRSGTYDLAVPHSIDVHALDNYRTLLHAIGVATHHLPALIAPPAMPGTPRAYAAFQMWPGGIRKEAKRWPAGNWLRLARDFAAWGFDVVLTGSLSDQSANNAFIALTERPWRARMRNAGGASLPLTAAILANARVVVSVDTGVMHMASALGAPLVALHGPTSAKRWGPFGDRAVAIESALPGCGYMHFGWERISARPACMESIRYETVRDACRALLDKDPRSHRERVDPEAFPAGVKR